MSQPTVLVLAAGLNSRMFPFSDSGHKGLLQLHGQMFLQRLFSDLLATNLKKVVLVVSSRDESSKPLAELLQNAPSELTITVVYQPEAKGMGDAVLLAQEHLAEEFIVVAPYHFGIQVTLQELVAHHSSAVICAQHTTTPWLYGVLDVKDVQALSVIEKPAQGSETSNLRVVALYKLNRTFLDILNRVAPDEYNFETALDELMKTTQVAVLTLAEPLLSLKYPWHLFDFQEKLFQKEPSSIHKTAHVAATASLDDSNGPIIIEAEATVGHAARLVGPCYIGAHAMVGDFSFVRESSIEAHATVGANTEIVRSIIFEGASTHYSYLADSIIGPKAKLGADLITANKRLDRENVQVLIKNHKVDSGRGRLGIMVGEAAQIGIKVGTMPGLTIGSQATIFPGVILYKNVEPSEIVKA